MSRETDKRLSKCVIAPHHANDLSEVEPIILEGVAYSPLKCAYKSSSHDESLEVRCNECEWTTTVGDLPRGTGFDDEETETSSYVQPNMCPACAKRGDIGFLRCQSPADGTFPVGWHSE